MHIEHPTRIVTVVGAILFACLIANFSVDGWNWGVLDFVFAAVMFAGVGIAIDFAAQRIQHPAQRMAAYVVIILAFLVVWAELAVGAVETFILKFL